MTKAQQQFRDLGETAMALLSDAYVEALNQIAKGGAPEKAWVGFRDMLVRAMILSSLIGASGVSTRMRVKVQNDPIADDEAARYAHDDSLLVGPFVDAINIFVDRVPSLRAEVERLAPLARAKAFWVTGVESNAAIGQIQDFINRRLQGQTDAGLTDFLDFAKDGPARNLALARLETVYRTNTQTALNEGIHRQLTTGVIQDATALWVLDEIQDRRTRGNPNGLYPNAGPHFQMDGFMARPGHPVWQRIWPPNGYNCRASVAPMTWARARQRGFAREDNTLIQNAVDRWNGRRWELIRSGEYPDRGFESGAVGLTAA